MSGSNPLEDEERSLRLPGTAPDCMDRSLPQEGAPDARLDKRFQR